MNVRCIITLGCYTITSRIYTITLFNILNYNV